MGKNPPYDYTTFGHHRINNGKTNTASLPDYRDVDFTDIPDGEDVMAAYENGYVGSAYSGEAEERSSLLSKRTAASGRCKTTQVHPASQTRYRKTILIHKEIEKMGWGAKIGYQPAMW